MSAMPWTPPPFLNSYTARLGMAGAEREAEALRKLNAPRWPETRLRPHPAAPPSCDGTEYTSHALGNESVRSPASAPPARPC